MACVFLVTEPRHRSNWWVTLDASADGSDTRAMSDTPTSDSKAKAKDAGQQGRDQDKRARKGRRRGGSGGSSKGKRRSDGEGGGERRREGGRRGGNRDDGRRGRGDRRSEQPLTAGLFAGVADREMPCRIAGCTNTWTWYGTQQIRSLGKPPPKRMCTEHLAQFEGIADRQMPCRNSWCENTWLWTRGAQLYQREKQGKLKAPHRLCESCFGEEKGTEDSNLPCKIPECENTWLWTRQAQLRHRAWVRRQQAKQEAEDREEAATDVAAEAASEPVTAEPANDAPSAEPTSEGSPAEASGEPAPVDAAAPAEAEASPAEAAPAEAPHAGAPAEAGSESVEPAEASSEAASDEATSDSSSEPPNHLSGESSESGVSGESGERGDSGQSHETASDAKPADGKRKRKRKRKRRRKIHDGPPEKLCERCFERLGHLEPIPVPCKVHGCTNTWSWEREGQLRAWARLDKQDEVTELPQPPRRMCHPCFEFVRAHTDRAVDCGRPDCDKTWTYKVGAQLQDFLAGRTQDPIRLCDSCARSQFTIRSASGVQLPEGAEVMPCQVSGCAESWVYVPGMDLAPADPDAAEPPIDRMCDGCRSERGAQARDPRHSKAAAESAVAEAGAPTRSNSPESAETETIPADSPEASEAAETGSRDTDTSVESRDATSSDPGAPDSPAS